VDTDNQNMVAF